MLAFGRDFVPMITLGNHFTYIECSSYQWDELSVRFKFISDMSDSCLSWPLIHGITFVIWIISHKLFLVTEDDVSGSELLICDCFILGQNVLHTQYSKSAKIIEIIIFRWVIHINHKMMCTVSMHFCQSRAGVNIFDPIWIFWSKISFYVIAFSTAFSPWNKSPYT